MFSGPLDRQVQYIVLSEKETDEDEAVAILNRILLIVPVGLGSFHFLHGAFLHSDCKCCIGLFTNDHVRSTYLYRKDSLESYSQNVEKTSVIVYSLITRIDPRKIWSPGTLEV